MSNQLSQQDWQSKINTCLERIITGSWAEYQYIANPGDTRLEYHRSVIRDIYLRNAQRGDFDIESVLEEIIDHDETQLETASEMVAKQNDVQQFYDCNQTSYEDMLLQLKLDLAEESGFCFFSDYASDMHNEDLPLFVLSVLAEMRAYFEICHPSKNTASRADMVPRAFGQFDAQTVIFDSMVEHEPLFFVPEASTINSALLCRLDRSRMQDRKTLKGDVSYA